MDTKKITFSRKELSMAEYGLKELKKVLPEGENEVEKKGRILAIAALETALKAIEVMNAQLNDNVVEQFRSREENK